MVINRRIQVLRGLAIIAVVLIHTCNGGMWQVFCRPFLNFAVPMFLFLSGYLTKTDNDHWSAFYKKRIIRVLIPYIIWTALYTLPHLTPLHLAYNLITARSAAMLYFIPVYIQFVLLTPLIGKMAKGKWQWIGWTIAPISVIIFKYYWLLTGTPLNHYVGLVWRISCLGWFSFYYLGLLLGNNLLDKSFNYAVVLLLFFISIPLQMAESFGWLVLGETDCGNAIKMTAFLTSTLSLILAYRYLISKKVFRCCGILSFLGDYSFGVFLSHIMIIRILSGISFSSRIPFPINTIIILIFSSLLVYLGHKICGQRISKWIGFV